MFTGIVEGVGEITSVHAQASHTKLAIRAPFSLKDTKVGDSIAIDGCCLTVTKKAGRVFQADISPETLRVTTLGKLVQGSKVNVERPLRVGDRLGGHWVQGHVDGVGKLESVKKVRAKPQNYFLLTVKVPKGLESYMVAKGSVTVDGISLTVNKVKSHLIELCIIPHTQHRTTLTGKKAGATLNLEADVLLKYIDQSFNRISKTWLAKQKTKSK